MFPRKQAKKTPQKTQTLLWFGAICPLQVAVVSRWPTGLPIKRLNKSKLLMRINHIIGWGHKSPVITYLCTQKLIWENKPPKNPVTQLVVYSCSSRNYSSRSNMFHLKLWPFRMESPRAPQTLTRAGLNLALALAKIQTPPHSDAKAWSSIWEK